jgi:lysophospholipase L1-like esterase
MTRRVFRCVALVTASLTVASCGYTTRKARAEGHPKPRQVVAHIPVVMFLGDSYTTGRLGQIPEETYAAYTARALGWQVIIGGYRGTGFVAKGSVGKTFADLFDEQLAWRPKPDLVIVSGGHNDRKHAPLAVAAAARQLLTTIERRWTKARVLLIGPMWGGDPEPDVLAVDDALKVVAMEQRVPYIDPLRERWITGNRREHTGNAEQYILPDGTHPSVEGARYISNLLVEDLRRIKLDEPK